MKSNKKVTIIGGGSSGWMAATFLNQIPNVDVTLVESSDVPVIGVGESTNVTTRGFHESITGFDEKEFMRASNATCKIAIRFENFNKLGGSFFHPFGGSFLKNMNGFFHNNAQSLHKEYYIAKKGNQFSKDCVYSYHVDAGLYGEFLKKRSVKNGVKHIIDNIKEVKLNKIGEIDYISTEKSGNLTADLFIDCTGFRSLLVDKALKVPFLNYNNYLINDSALAVRIPYKNRKQELHPYTNCHALSSGWVWRIPLWSRLGIGYVFSSQFTTAEKAEIELRDYLKMSASEPLDINHVKIRVGRHQRAWNGNCIGLGLAFSFLEPLESTGLSLTQAAIVDLAIALVNGGTSVEREIFNQKQNNKFDRTRDFILAHYTLTQREDTPYWKYIKYSNPISDSLAQILHQARNKKFTLLEDDNHFYSNYNWNLILSGMGFFNEDIQLKKMPQLPKIQSHEDFLKSYVYAEKEVAKIKKKESKGLHPTW